MKVAGLRQVGARTAAVLLVLAGQAQFASAQMVDVAGDWTFEVTTEQGVTMPTLTLEQDGDMLTGHYSSETLGEADVAGRVDGSEVTISFSADPGVGQEVPVVYVGTVDENGVMTGTLDIAGGLATGTFTATRD